MSFKKHLNLDNLKYILRNKFLFGALCSLLINGASKKTLELIRLSIQLKQVKSMRRHVRKKIKELPDKERIICRIDEPHKIVWVCWFQGINNAPNIVKTCFQSVEGIEGKEVILVTEKNFQEYTEFPQHILEKWKKGLITPTHFSDLLRVELLTRHGGIWLDATIYLTCESLPSYIDYSSFFCYQILKPGLNGQSIICSSWALSSSKDNEILSLTKDVLYRYWYKNNHLIDYFLFHIVLSAIVYELENYDVYMVKQCNSAPHILQFEMLSKFSQVRWKEILCSTSIHKLTYKINIKKDLKGTFLEKMLNHYD